MQAFFNCVTRAGRSCTVEVRAQCTTFSNKHSHSQRSFKIRLRTSSFQYLRNVLINRFTFRITIDATHCRTAITCSCKCLVTRKLRHGTHKTHRILAQAKSYSLPRSFMLSIAEQNTWRSASPQLKKKNLNNV